MEGVVDKAMTTYTWNWREYVLSTLITVIVQDSFRKLTLQLFTCFNFRQEHPPKYLAHGSKLGVPPARRDSNQIYVVSVRESKFTEDDVRNYFRYCRLTLVLSAFDRSLYLLCSCK